MKIRFYVFESLPEHVAMVASICMMCIVDTSAS
jgi:hypothetical protein